MKSQEDERRRNCADRLRAAVAQHRMQRGKRVDPALSVAVQMLALTSMLINLFPPLPSRRSVALPAPASRPVTSVEPFRPYERYKISPSWSRLMKDLARPVARLEARLQVYARLPLEVRPWLDHVFANEDWASIRPFARSGATDAEVIAGATLAHKQWLDAMQQRVKDRTQELGGEAGRAGAGSNPSADVAPHDDEDGRIKP